MSSYANRRIAELIQAYRAYLVSFEKYEKGERNFHYLTKAQGDLETQLWINRDAIAERFIADVSKRPR